MLKFTKTFLTMSCLILVLLLCLYGSVPAQDMASSAMQIDTTLAQKVKSDLPGEGIWGGETQSLQAVFPDSVPLINSPTGALQGKRETSKSIESKVETGMDVFPNHEEKARIKEKFEGNVEQESPGERDVQSGSLNIKLPLIDNDPVNLLAVGEIILSSGTQNYSIPDYGYRWVQMWSLATLPAGAYVTDLEYRLRIDDSGDPATFYCGDYEVWLSSEAHGSPNKYLLVYNNLGGRTDGGFDDDAEDDSDIYLNWRSTSAFNGEDPTQRWCVWVEDNIRGDSGILNYIEFTIHWEAPDTEPDLTCPWLWYQSDEVTEGNSYWIRPRIQNDGAAVAGASHARLFLSTDNDWDVSDDYEVLPKKSVSSLSPGVYEEVQWDMSSFPDLGSGDYDVWIVVMVDCDDEVAESNESNLYKTTNSITVHSIDMPDLTCPWVSWQSNEVTEGDAYWIRPRIQNDGTAVAGASHARLFLSTDDDWDISDDYEVLPKKSVSSLSPGVYDELQWDISSFPDLGSGDYDVWFVIMVDCDDEVTESDEVNLYKTVDPILVHGGGVTMPDLTCPWVWYQSSEVTEGNSYWIRPRIQNDGTAVAGVSHAQLFLSTDNDWDVSDDYEVLPKKSVSSLSPGVYEEVQWDISSFPDLDSGDYDVWLVIVVDCDDEVVESNEINTYKSSTAITVHDGTPLIAVQPMQLDIYEPAPTFPGDNNIPENALSALRNNDRELGSIIPEEVKQYWQKTVPLLAYNVYELEAAIDWSSNDSPVKNQGQCGSCWAFSTIGLIENLSGMADLSEQVVVSCVPPVGGINNDCSGGWHGYALEYINTDGAPEESCYPYIAQNGNCADKCSDPSHLVKVENYDKYGQWGETGATTINDLKALLQLGPVLVHMLVPNDGTFNDYTSGIYNYDGGTIPETQGHSVLVVGYDDVAEYFKVKNSWGSAWGENGYFRISFDDVTDDVKFGGYACTASGINIEGEENVFTISNVGGGILEVSSINSDKTWLTFTPTVPPTLTIAAGASNSIQCIVQWNNVPAPSDEATVTIQSNDGTNNPVYVTVTAYKSTPNPPDAPTLLSPADGAIDQILTLALDWSDVSGAVSYGLQVSRNEGFTDLVIDQSGLTSSNHTVTTGVLENGTTYYWRANASNMGGSSPWSEIWDFTTIPNPPDAPSLVSPVDGAIDQILTLALDWSDVSGAASYGLQVSRNEGFTDLVIDQSGLGSSNFAVTAGMLAAATKYYWRANASNVGGSSPWSEIWDFTTISNPPDAPTLVSPVDGAIDQILTLALDWSDVSGAASYGLQVSRNEGFTDLVIDQSGLGSSNFAVTAGVLTNATTYYWRANAANVGGSSPWSEIWDFTTIPNPPDAPTLVSPSDGAIDQSLTLILDWTDVSGASSYGLQVSRNTDFTDLVIDLSGLGSSNHAVTAGVLTNATTYYWRANAANIAGAGDWSGAREFTTIPNPPDAPTLVSPADGAIDQSLTLILDWTDVSGASSYGLQVSRNTDFTDLVIDLSGLGSSNHAVTAGVLTNATTYYWRANAYNVSGPGPWSATWDFTTIPNPPAAPTLVSPADGALNQSLTLILDWSDVSNAASYGLQVSRNAGFTDLVIDQSGLGSSNFAVTTGMLTAETQYYWRANAYNMGGPGPWSAAWNFTTIPNPPAAPTLVSPADGALNQSLTLILDWSDVSAAASYGVQVSRNIGFTDLVIDQSGLGSSNFAVTTGMLTAETQYYWRANAYNIGGLGPWSGSWDFTTIPSAPAAPTNLVANAISVNQIDLTWQDNSDNEDEFIIERKTESGGTWGELITLGVNETSYSDMGLTENTTYWYRVCAVNAGGQSDFSNETSTQTPTSILGKYANQIPETFVLKQNYPNPFNPTTTIIYGLPEAAFVTIKIYNIAGQLVTELVAKQKAAGYHFVAWDAQYLPSSAYYCILQSGNHIDVMKMILIK